jgi:hypothetical protein
MPLAHEVGVLGDEQRGEPVVTFHHGRASLQVMTRRLIEGGPTEWLARE